jgi:hypothetical protein
MKRILLIFLLIIMFLPGVYCQLSGISGSKLGAYNSDPITPQTVEFEPVLESGWSKMRWDHNGERINLFSTGDSIRKYTLLSFRMTYGIYPGLEAGVSVSGDFEMISFAFKQKLMDKGIFSTSLIGGMNYMAGNQVFSRTGFKHMHNSVILGFASSIAPANRFSIDFDVQMEPGIKKINGINDYNHFYSNIDAGYYLKGAFQLIGGLSWAYINRVGEDGQQEQSSIVKLNPGFTIEEGKNFIIVGGFPFCVAGKNYDCSAGFMLALTIIID